MRQTKLSIIIVLSVLQSDFTFIKFSRGQPSSAPPPLALVLGACNASAPTIRQQCTLTSAERIADTHGRFDTMWDEGNLARLERRTLA